MSRDPDPSAESSLELIATNLAEIVEQLERIAEALAARRPAVPPPAPPAENAGPALGATTVTRPNSTGGLSSFRTRRFPGDDPSENG
jgi:hypothetical protein